MSVPIVSRDSVGSHAVHLTTTASAAVHAELRATFERQRAHAGAVARTSAAERRERLRRLREAVLARRETLYDALAKDLGRPSAETELTEIHSVITEIDHAVKKVGRWMRGERLGASLTVAGTSTRLTYEPRGVALILAPWNYPIGLLLNPLVAAMAAGNCVVLKPSEKAPATSAVLRELVAATFDPAEVALVEGGPDVAAALLDLPWDHVFFTGGTQIGRIVMAAAARHLSSVTLELGGKSPAFVDASADVTQAARRIVVGRFMNAGQTCIAPDYVLVHASVERAFLDAATAAVAEFYGATEEDRAASRDYARIVDEAHFLRLRDLAERSIAQGARVECGARFDAASRYVAPTILSAVPPDAPIMESEIFGPVLPVLAWRELEEAMRFVREGGKPLAMFVFARDRALVRALLAGTSAGATVVGNVGMHYFHLDAPFGGVGTSGMGAYHGVHGFREFSHARTVMRQREPASISLFLPPYRGWRYAVGQRLLRLIQWLR
jgi:aldehyde dehydrogenase (NAD+)